MLCSVLTAEAQNDNNAEEGAATDNNADLCTWG